jgi:putative membrane protein
MSRPEDIDVDVRFLLANERTWLAWLRTALTMIAGGVALAQLSEGRGPLMMVAFALLALGSVAGLIGYQRYRAAGRAIRAGRLPEAGRAPALITAAIAFVAVAITLVYVL